MFLSVFEYDSTPLANCTGAFAIILEGYKWDKILNYVCWFLAIIHLEVDKSGHEEAAARSCPVNKLYW